MAEVQKPELLAPAGDMEKLKVACIYGADAVYLGGPAFGLRAHAGNFSLEEMQEGITFAHDLGKKVYVTVNIFAQNNDINEAKVYLKSLGMIGVDGLLVSDLGLFDLARSVVPDIPLHVSTQANTTNYASCRKWQEMGAKRVVMAREVSLADIKVVGEKTEGLELEAFVHGAMCMAYSGRCLLSAHMTGRSANLGECSHPCRYKYRLVEEMRPNEFMPVEEDEAGTYILSPADLCMIEFIPQLVEAGLHSLKIEGRMKSIHYVATVVKAYRQAIDAFFTSHWNYITAMSVCVPELGKSGARPLNTGFYFGSPQATLEKARDAGQFLFVGLVLDFDAQKQRILVEQRNKFSIGDLLEVLSPSGDNVRFRVEKIHTLDGGDRESAPHPQEKLYLSIPLRVEPWSLLRKVLSKEESR